MNKIIGLYSNEPYEAEQLIRAALRDGYNQPVLFSGTDNHTVFTRQFEIQRADNVEAAQGLTIKKFGKKADFGVWEGPARELPQCPLPETVAVVVTSHNYGQFIGECLDSVMAQTRKADEVIVVDDASDDDTQEVVSEYLSRGVKYIKVNNRSAILTRRDGFLQTESEVVLFLDADDILESDFIECGLKEFIHKQVGVVYCDHIHFGISDHKTNFPPYTKDRLFKGPNFVSACSFVRREALLICDAWDYGGTDMHQPEDYWMFQRIALDGWDFRKQTALLRYRRHAESRSQTRASARRDLNYYETHGLEHHTVTLFIPLAGRKWMWPRLSAYLDRQTWPHDQIRLILCDTGQDAEFSEIVREWIAGCDYSDVRHFQMDVGAAGLADENRRKRDVQMQVKRAVCRIYNHLRQMLDTPYCWILEDDIIPPDDVLQRLLWHFHYNVGAVTAPYQSRYNGTPVVWKRDERITEPGEGVTDVHGSGFGCLVVREELVKKHLLPIRSNRQDLDPYFFDSIEESWRRLCDWSCACEHWGEEGVYLIGDTNGN